MAVLPVAGEDVLKVNTAHWTALSSPSTLYLEEQTGWRVDCPLLSTICQSGIQAFTLR